MASSKSKEPMGLDALFEHALKDMYYAEKKIYRSLPKMIRAADDPTLKEALTAHRDETQGQIEVLEQVFELLGKRPKAEQCDAMDGILEEATSLLEDFQGGAANDSAIIFSAQAVEHYEISRYGSMHAYAVQLKMKDAAKLIKGILDQEYAADKSLSALAEEQLNAKAA